MVSIQAHPFYKGKPLTKIVAKSTRNIYKVGDDLVLKFDDEPDSSDYWLDNQTDREIQLWNCLDPRDKKYFAKIKDYGFSEIGDLKHAWILQEFIKLKPQRGQVLDNDIVRTIKRLSNKYNIADLSTSHYYSCVFNWGLRQNGDLVIYDYGGFQGKKKK